MGEIIKSLSESSILLEVVGYCIILFGSLFGSLLALIGGITGYIVKRILSEYIREKTAMWKEIRDNTEDIQYIKGRIDNGHFK